MKIGTITIELRYILPNSLIEAAGKNQCLDHDSR